MSSTRRLPRHLSDADFKSCVEDMGAAHRRFRRVVTDSADAIRHGGQEDQPSVDTEPHSLLELLTRVLEASAFPTDETQDLARDCPALVTAWLDNGKSDIDALAGYQTIEDHPELLKAVQTWLAEATTTITHLSQNYECVVRLLGMPGLISSQTTDDPVYWTQRATEKAEESIEITKTILKLWTKTVEDHVHSGDISDLCRYLNSAETYWEMPWYWSGERKSKLRRILQQQDLQANFTGKAQGLAQEDTALVLETAMGFKAMCKSPIKRLEKYLRDSLRDRKSDLDLTATALKWPSEMCPQIASRKDRIEQNIRDAIEYRDKAVTLSNSSQVVESRGRLDEATEAPRTETPGLQIDSTANDLTEKLI